MSSPLRVAQPPPAPWDRWGGHGLHFFYLLTPIIHPSPIISLLLCSLIPYRLTAGNPKIPFCYRCCSQPRSQRKGSDSFNNTSLLLSRRKKGRNMQPLRSRCVPLKQMGCGRAQWFSRCLPCLARLQPGPHFSAVVGTSPGTPRRPHAGHPYPRAGKCTSFQPVVYFGVILLRHVICLRWLPIRSSLLSVCGGEMQ